MAVALEVVFALTEDETNPKPRVPVLRPEDAFFFDDGWRNMVAKTLVAAVSDARNIGKRPTIHQGALKERCHCRRCAESKLMNWVFSDRFREMCSFVGVDPDELETLLCGLVDA